MASTWDDLQSCWFEFKATSSNLFDTPMSPQSPRLLATSYNDNHVEKDATREGMGL